MKTLTSKQRRRIAKLFRRIVRRIADERAVDETVDEGCVFICRRHTPCKFRDTRRLQEMGKVICASSRPSWVYPGEAREIAVFLRRDALLKRYHEWSIMR